MLLLLLVAYMKGAGDKDAAWEARWLARDKAEAVAALKASEAARKWEQDKDAEFAIVNDLHQERVNDIQNQRDRIIRDYRAHLGRLSFKPARCPVPEAPADSGQPAQGEEGGQPGMVGEAITARFAVCDEVTLERNQAVELLRAERK